MHRCEYIDINNSNTNNEIKEKHVHLCSKKNINYNNSSTNNEIK